MTDFILQNVPSSSAWSSLTNASGNLTLANGTNTTEFDQTSNVTWKWYNTTTATNSTTNNSPVLDLSANYWTGAASAEDKWTITSSLAAGTNGASTLTIAHSGSTGAAKFSVGGVNNLIWDGGSSATLTLGTSNPPIITAVSGASLQVRAPSGQNVLMQPGVTNPWAFLSGGALSGASTSPLVWTASTDTATADSGISRLGAASLAVGNGTASDTTGNLSFGKIIKYNGTATVRNGQPAEYASSDLTVQSAAITATTLISAPATGAYRVAWSATITTADGVSSVLGGTNGFQVIYTSPTDSVVKTTVAGNSTTSSANTTGTAVGGDIVIYAKSATNIQFQYGYTSNTPGQMVYELHITVEAL